MASNKHVTELDETKDDGNKAAASANDTPPEPQEILPHAQYGKYGLSGERVRITIHEQSDDLGRQPVYAAYGQVNRPPYECLIPRGVEVILPAEVFETCIKGAVKTDFPEDKDGNRTPREVGRFAYTFHGKF